MPKDYVCPECDHMFQVGSLKSLFTKRTSEGRVLRCPRCGKKSPFKD
ncbi:MAG: hypothetical protein IJL79_02175 [Candidatus Methanomethylophilaceae archaeon]|nr:hypothetical protein [Candidatus Methanomethylophilaceae archaeon]